MNKWIAIPVIAALVIAVIVNGYFVAQQNNKLGEAESGVVALENSVSILEDNVSVQEGKLTDLEAKVSTLEADLDKANDVELQQKLVGFGSYAPSFEMEGAHCNLNSSFILTNPNSISDITIERICVFAYDGTVVYEGSLLHWREETPWLEPMKPHETRESELAQYVSEFEWPSESEEWMMFTVEIFWTTKGGLPLTGWVGTAIIKRDAATQALIDIEYAGATQMVNMAQALEPEH